MTSCWDRGRDTTVCLTEVRTVLSRAEAAYRSILRNQDRDEHSETMLFALGEAIYHLEAWQKTGQLAKKDRCGLRDRFGHECTRPKAHLARCNNWDRVE